MQSLDSKAIKIALGVPVYANSANSYKEACVLPLSEIRKLAVSKYLIRSLGVPNSVREDIFLDREKDYPKRSRNILFLQPIFNYTDSLMKENGIDVSATPVLPVVPQHPPWEHKSANFDIDYTDIKKVEDQNLLTVKVRSRLEQHYHNHLKIFTDGSVLESKKVELPSSYLL